MESNINVYEFIFYKPFSENKQHNYTHFISIITLYYYTTSTSYTVLLLLDIISWCLFTNSE